MSAKEIVKRLKDSLDYEFDLSFNERKELLSYIEQLENNRDKAIEYVENMPYLQETDNEYEDINGHTYFTYKEWDNSELLKLLKGDSDDTR